MDEANDVARLRGLRDERAHRVPRGNVDGRHTDVVAGVSHDLGGSVGVDLAPVRQHHVLADPDAPGDLCPAPMTTTLCMALYLRRALRWSMCPTRQSWGCRPSPSNDSQMFLGIPCPFHLEVG